MLQQWYNKIFLSIFLESVESSLFFTFNDFGCIILSDYWLFLPLCCSLFALSTLLP